MPRNYLYARVCMLVALLLCAGQLAAQSYPTKPVRFLVGFAAGGATDISARMLAQRLSEHFGQSVLVENRAGSGGLIATEAVSRAAADGHTLLMMPAADAVQPAMRRKLPYDLEQDFTAIGRVVTGPWVVVVHPSVPARSIGELIALARQRPGGLNYGTSGIGSSAHIANELFNSMTKVRMVHIAYKGVAEGVRATAMGETDMIFASITAAKPLLDARKARPLAVSTIERTRLMPDMPTLHESGVAGYDRSGWYGVLAPAGLPADILGRLNTAIGVVVNTPAMQEAFNRQGLEPATMTPGAFAAFISREVATNIKVVKDAGIPVQ